MMNTIDSFLNTVRQNKLVQLCCIIIGVLILFRLIASITNSGYNYIFDNDELHHTQVIFLLSNGYKPFTDIYLTVYTPIFHWFIQPIFTWSGFSFDTMYHARIVMIGLFLLRISILGLLSSVLFGKKIGIISIVLLLLSPFAIFAEMQIRPDNLMITVFLLGLLCSAYGWKAKKTVFHAVSSFFIMMSLLILMKIVPSVLLFYVISGFWMIKTKQWNALAGIGCGALLALLLFCLPFLFTGTFYEMTQQVIVESISSYSGVFEFPVPLGFFYRPSNPALFGLPGKPLNWILSWIVLIVSSAGVFHLFETSWKEKQSWKIPLYTMLIGSFVSQFAFLFLLESVFIQHYISLNWLFALFTAVIIIHIYSYARLLPFGSLVYTAILMIGSGMLINQSIHANDIRATITSDELTSRFERIWAIIPPEETVFPNILFRKLAYPVPYGHFIGNMPDQILNRLPNISASLALNNTKYVYIDEYYFTRIPQYAQQYIASQYMKSDIDPQLYIKR